VSTFTPTPSYPVNLTYIALVLVIVLCWMPDALSIFGDVPLASPGMIAAVGIALISGIPVRPHILDRTGTRTVLTILTASFFITMWSLISVLDAPDPLRSGRVILTHVSGAAIFVLLYATFTVGRTHRIVRFLAFMAAVMSLLSLGAYFDDTLRHIFFEETDRSKALFKNPNQFGIALSTVAPAALALALGSPHSRIANLCFVGLICFGLIAAGSKTNLLIFSANAAFMLVLAPILEPNATRRLNHALRNLLLGVAALLGGPAALAAFNPRALLILEKFFSPDENVASLESRRVIWDYSIEKFQENVIFGEGAGQRINVFIRANESVPHSHNLFLDYLRMLGLPGGIAITFVVLALIVFLISTVVLACRARGTKYEDRLLVVGLALGGIAYIMANLSSDSLGPSTSPFGWFVIYLAMFMRCTLRISMPWRALTVADLLSPRLSPQPKRIAADFSRRLEGSRGVRPA
jgi:O-antigen ligase